MRNKFSHLSALFVTNRLKEITFEQIDIVQKSVGGISYVEESETKSDLLSPQLPPIVYQPQNLKISASQFLTNCFYTNILNGKTCISIMSDDENKLKQVLNENNKIIISVFVISTITFFIL